MEENKSQRLNFVGPLCSGPYSSSILIAALPYSFINFVVMISVAPAGELITKLVLFYFNIVTVWFSFHRRKIFTFFWNQRIQSKGCSR